jgi:hypothetical protein
VACGKPNPEVQEPPQWAIDAYQAASHRLVDQHLENGWVVTRRPDGSAEHVGDALIWTGLALYGLPCDLGELVEDHLIEVITRNGGALVRYEPLGDYAGGREVSLDGALGLYRGVASRSVRCGTAAKWRPVIGQHIDYMREHGGRLNAGSSASLEGFDALPVSLHRHLAGGADPGDGDYSPSVSRLILWTGAVTATKSACFRIHLSWLILRTWQEIGAEFRPETRWAFCAAANGSNIPVVDHWCNRGDLSGWAESYEPNRWEYAHQRCSGWESPDGDGDETPGLDLLVGLREAYRL